MGPIPVYYEYGMHVGIIIFYLLPFLYLVIRIVAPSDMLGLCSSKWADVRKYLVTNDNHLAAPALTDCDVIGGLLYDFSICNVSICNRGEHTTNSLNRTNKFVLPNNGPFFIPRISTMMSTESDAINTFLPQKLHIWKDEHKPWNGGVSFFKYFPFD